MTRLIITHPSNLPINRGTIVDINSTIKLRVTSVVAYVTYKDRDFCDSQCECEIVVNMVGGNL